MKNFFYAAITPCVLGITWPGTGLHVDYPVWSEPLVIVSALRRDGPEDPAHVLLEIQDVVPHSDWTLDTVTSGISSIMNFFTLSHWTRMELENHYRITGRPVLETSDSAAHLCDSINKCAVWYAVCTVQRACSRESSGEWVLDGPAISDLLFQFEWMEYSHLMTRFEVTSPKGVTAFADEEETFIH